MKRNRLSSFLSFFFPCLVLFGMISFIDIIKASLNVFYFEIPFTFTSWQLSVYVSFKLGSFRSLSDCIITASFYGFTMYVCDQILLGYRYLPHDIITSDKFLKRYLETSVNDIHMCMCIRVM